VRSITASPLTIFLGDETSMQVVNDTDFVGLQFNPGSCSPGQTGDAGVFVSVAGVVYGPDFGNHPCGSFANAVTPWTPVSISPVTGSGTASDPFAVVVVVDAGSTGLRLTETLRYFNGSPIIVPVLAFSNHGSTPITWDTFLAADLFLGGSAVSLLRQGGAPGGRAARVLGAPLPACFPLPYAVLLPAGDRYSANASHQVWDEISAGGLSNTVGFLCSGSGIASQWTGRTLNSGGASVITTGSGILFTNLPTGAVPVPAMSIVGLGAFFVGLVLAAYVVNRRS
jgi:hypothetical protein